MDYAKDPRVVLTLDAGGTKFAFAAVQAERLVGEPVVLPSNGDDLAACLRTMVEGFSRVKDASPAPPAAISFAFPGPADYPRGIIGDLGNLPGFQGGVALGPLLEDRFGSRSTSTTTATCSPSARRSRASCRGSTACWSGAGSPKRFRNLFGATFGTGFGGGIVQDGRLWIGDNSAGGEIWLLRNKLDPRANIEEAVSIRAVRRVYAEKAGDRARRSAGAEGDLRDRPRHGRPATATPPSRRSAGWARPPGDALANGDHPGRRSGRDRRRAHRRRRSCSCRRSSPR